MLEDKLQSKLNVPWISASTCDYSVSRSSRTAGRSTKVGKVPRIVKLSTKLQFESLAEAKVLKQGKVPVMQRRRVKQVSRHSSKPRSTGREQCLLVSGRKATRIEPLSHGLWANAIADSVGPVKE